MGNRFKISTIIFLTILSLTSICQSQNVLNLNNFTFNDSVIKEFNIEKVTNMLGRPTATNNNPIAPELVEITGAQIYYHDMGLMFWFHPKSSDSQKRLWIIKVYLVKKWDEDFNKFFLPFTNKIYPALNSNMKSDQIVSLFDKYNPKVKSAEESRKDFEESMKKYGLKSSSDIVHDRIIVKTDKGIIKLECEELTKFLDYFIIQCVSTNN